MIERLGILLNCQAESGPMVETMRVTYEQVTVEAASQPRLRVFCPIWRKPWMAFNHDTYSDDMLWTCGGENVLRTKTERYFTVTLEELETPAPPVVLLPHEPFPLSTKPLLHLQTLAP